MKLLPSNRIAGASAIETWVRPFQAPPSLLQRALDAIPPETTDAEANDRFGKPTPIELQGGGFGGIGGLQAAPAIRRTFNWTNPADQQDQQDQEIILVYNEISRETMTTRITSPDDPAVYVDVEDATSILFDGPDGFKRQFVFVPR